MTSSDTGAPGNLDRPDHAPVVWLWYVACHGTTAPTGSLDPGTPPSALPPSPDVLASLRWALWEQRLLYDASESRSQSAQSPHTLIEIPAHAA